MTTSRDCSSNSSARIPGRFSPPANSRRGCQTSFGREMTQCAGFWIEPGIPAIKCLVVSQKRVLEIRLSFGSYTKSLDAFVERDGACYLSCFVGEVRYLRRHPNPPIARLHTTRLCALVNETPATSNAGGVIQPRRDSEFVFTATMSGARPLIPLPFMASRTRVTAKKKLANTDETTRAANIASTLTKHLGTLPTSFA
jgi:hypothetical protein